MLRLWTATTLAIALVLGGSTPAPAADSTPVQLLCNKFVGPLAANVAYGTRAPRRCTIWRRNWPHYRALTFTNATWTRWGRRSAHARAIVTGNGGYRSAARITAYRLRRDCTGGYLVYTRVSLVLSGPRRTTVYRPDTCADL
jgi:hypothetical protein